MKQIDDLPLEIHEKILSYLMTDPFTLHRIELVCQLWASIIRFFENKRGLNFRRIKVFKSNETRMQRIVGKESLLVVAILVYSDIAM